jgi:hypothetical protein
VVFKFYLRFGPKPNELFILLGAGPGSLQLGFRLMNPIMVSTAMNAPFLIEPPPYANGMEVVHSEEEKQRFAEDPLVYQAYRKKIEAGLNQSQLVTFRGTEIQKQFWKLCQDSMKEKLKKKPHVYDALCPAEAYPPGCRRITPGPGFLEALVEDNVEVVSSGVKQVTDSGLYDDNGNFHKVDAIIYATGFD